MHFAFHMFQEYKRTWQLSVRPASATPYRRDSELRSSSDACMLLPVALAQSLANSAVESGTHAGYQMATVLSPAMTVTDTVTWFRPSSAAPVKQHKTAAQPDHTPLTPDPHDVPNSCSCTSNRMHQADSSQGQYPADHGAYVSLA